MHHAFNLAGALALIVGTLFDGDIATTLFCTGFILLTLGQVLGAIHDILLEQRVERYQHYVDWLLDEPCGKENSNNE